MKQLVLYLGLGYLMLCLGLFLLQRKMQYFPTPPLPIKGAQAVSFDHQGITLRGWQANPDQESALLYFGGNGEQVEQNLEQFRQWFPHHSIYLIPYRGYGNSDGSPTEQGIVADALYLFDELSQAHPRITVVGRSLGSGVAVQVAASRPVDRVVLVTPFDSALAVARDLYWMFPLSVLMKDPYRSDLLAPRIDAPSYVVIAGDDEVIPLKRTQALVDALGPNLQWSRKIEGAGHNTLSLYPEYGHALKQPINDDD